MRARSGEEVRVPVELVLVYEEADPGINFEGGCTVMGLEVKGRRLALELSRVRVDGVVDIRYAFDEDGTQGLRSIEEAHGIRLQKRGMPEEVVMAATRTPGTLYFVRQQFPSLTWSVVPIQEDQGRRMRERGEKNVFDSSAQAYAVADRLEKARLEGKDEAAKLLSYPEKEV